MLFCMALSRIARQMFLRGLSETEMAKGKTVDKTCADCCFARSSYAREDMFRHLLLMVGFGLAASAMFYAWWRCAVLLHEFRERLYRDKYRLITLFTYRGKSDNR
jgi:hypothetical protein